MRRLCPPAVLAAVVLVPSAATAASFQGLGFLQVDGGQTVPMDVSGDGLTVVGHAGPPQEAFRWTAETGMVGLDVLPGYPYSDGTAVSVDGSVAVGMSHDSTMAEALRIARGPAAAPRIQLLVAS